MIVKLKTSLKHSNVFVRSLLTRQHFARFSDVRAVDEISILFKCYQMTAQTCNQLSAICCCFLPIIELLQQKVVLIFVIVYISLSQMIELKTRTKRRLMFALIASPKPDEKNMSVWYMNLAIICLAVTFETRGKQINFN